MRYNMARALASQQDDLASNTINRLQRDLHELVEITDVLDTSVGVEGAEVQAEDNMVTSKLIYSATWNYGTYATYEGHPYVVFQGSDLVRSHTSDGNPVYHLPSNNKDITYIIIKSHDFLSELR